MPAHILLIDDEKDFSDSIIEFFKIEGINVDYASDWSKGIDLFTVGLHELVIADYHLPGSKHGLKLLLSLKGMRPSSKLILISGAVTNLPAAKIKESGIVDEFFTKGQGLIDSLEKHVKDAVARAQSNSKWTEIAKANVAKKTLDDRKIDEIDALMTTKLQK